MIQLLRTLAKAVTPVAFDIYDQEDPQPTIERIARIRQTSPGQKRLALEWWTAFPQLRKWVGDRVTQRVFQDALEISITPHEITFDMDREDVQSEDAILVAEDLAESIGRGFAHGKLDIAYGPLKRNEITYDGQNFFDTDHRHPDESTFSNILSPALGDFAARATPGAPTVAEVRDELRAAMSRLLLNRLIRRSLVRTPNISTNLTIITRSHNVQRAFEDLREEKEINGDENRFRNTFELLQDTDPSAGEESSWDVIHSVPGGPRPVIFAVAREPRGLEFDTTQLFRNRYIPFGMDGRYGSAAAFPQTSARVME